MINNCYIIIDFVDKTLGNLHTGYICGNPTDMSSISIEPIESCPTLFSSEDANQIFFNYHPKETDFNGYHIDVDEYKLTIHEINFYNAKISTLYQHDNYIKPVRNMDSIFIPDSLVNIGGVTFVSYVRYNPTFKSNIIKCRCVEGEFIWNDLQKEQDQLSKIYNLKTPAMSRKLARDMSFLMSFEKFNEQLKKEVG